MKKEVAVKEKGKVVEMQEKLEALKVMSARELVEHAKKEFKQDLPLGNGRPWIYKKTAYLEQERLTGNNGKAAEKAKKLDMPEEIEKMKKEEEKEQAAKKIDKKTGTKAAKKVDEYGFREGTKASGMFAALIKGTTRAEFEKIGGKEAYNLMRAIKKPVESCSAGRTAVIVEKDGVLKIQSYKNK